MKDVKLVNYDNLNVKDELQTEFSFKSTNSLKDLVANLGHSFDKQADILQALENESIDAQALLLFSPRQLEYLIPELTMIDCHKLINEAISQFKGEVTTLSKIIKESKEKRNFIYYIRFITCFIIISNIKIKYQIFIQFSKKCF